MDLGGLNILLGADLSSFNAGLATASRSLNAFATQAAATGDKAGGSLATGLSQSERAAQAANSSFSSLGRSLNSNLVQSFEAADKSRAKLDDGIGRLASNARSAGQALSIGVTLPLGLLAGAAIKSFASLDSLERGFAATYKGAAPLADALKEVDELAKLPGLGLTEARQGATNLQAAGFSAQQATKALGAFGNALATVGKGKAELDSVTYALTQINNTDFVQGQDLNQLRNALPQIGEVLKKAFGTTNTEGLRKLGVTSKQFIETVTNEFAKLPQVSAGPANALENLADVGTISLGRLGKAFNQSFDLSKISDAIGGFASRVLDAFDSLSPGVQKAIFVFAGVAAAVGPVLVGLGALGAAIPAITAGFAALGVTSAAALGPIGIGIAAVAAGAYLIIDNWDTLVAYFTQGEGGRVFTDLADSVTSAVAAIKGAFAGLSGALGNNLGQLLGSAGLGLLKTLVREIGDGITAVLKTVSGLITGITGLINLDGRAALEGFSTALDGLTTPIRSLLGLLDKGTTTKDFFGSLGESANRSKAGLSNYFASLNNGLTGVNAFTGAVATANTALGQTPPAAAQSITSLETLKARLKALQETFQKQQVGTVAFFDTKQQIADLEALIKKYEDQGAAARKAADAVKAAFTSLRNDLRGVDTDVKIGIIAEGVDEATAKIDKLEAGLTKLAKLGVTTANSAFRSFSEQLVTLRKSLNTVTEPLEFNVVPEVRIDRTIADTLDKEVQNILGDDFKSQSLTLPIRLDLPFATYSDQAKSVLNANIALATSFSDINKQSLVFGSAFDTAAARASAVQAALKSLLAEGVDPLSPRIKELADQFQTLTEQQSLITDFRQGMASAFNGIAESVGTALGALTTGAAGIGDSLRYVFGNIISAIGDFAVTFGQQLIAIGVAKLALDSLFKAGAAGGVAAIAAGIGLVALGGIVKAVGKQAAGNLGAITGAGSGYSGGSTVTAPATSTVKPQQIEVKFAPLELNVAIDQGSLRRFLQLDPYRQTRFN